MSEVEALKNLKQWRTWAAKVEQRWTPGSPMVMLAHRRVLEAELRLLEVRSAARFN